MKKILHDFMQEILKEHYIERGIKSKYMQVRNVSDVSTIDN